MSEQFSLFDSARPKGPYQSPQVVEAKPEIRNASEKRKQMLDRLKRGPLSTVEAERLHHRGQATIGALRDEGHIIELVKLAGVDHYKYIDFQKRERVTPSLQELYYKTRHWVGLSHKRKQVDRFKCQQCYSHLNLETHHWRYNLFAEDLMRDLITLCRVCHEDIHECASGSKVMHFPRWIDAELAQRIREGK